MGILSVVHEGKEVVELSKKLELVAGLAKDEVGEALKDLGEAKDHIVDLIAGAKEIIKGEKKEESK